MTLHIRPERSSDEAVIHTLTETAFAPMPYGDGTEAPLIAELRRAGDLTLSLVAERAGEVLGHIAFSPASLQGRHDGWFGLGPISVWPDHQRSGIGTALVTEGLRQMEAAGATGSVLIGNPKYYCRFGFRPEDGLTYRSHSPHIVQAISFRGPPAHGELRFAPAFEAIEDS